MRTLKEQMALDRPTFLNPSEFGEALLIDGAPCLGSWQQEMDEPVKQFFGSGFDTVPGVFTQDRVLFVMRRDRTAMIPPVPTQELEIDGAIWTVRDALIEDGILKLVLYRNAT